jgi:hypothetical protein
MARASKSIHKPPTIVRAGVLVLVALLVGVLVAAVAGVVSWLWFWVVALVGLGVSQLLKRVY